MRKMNRIVSLTVALCMLCTMLSCLCLTAFAEGEVTLTFSGANTAPITGTAGESVILPTPTVELPGYKFVGWTTYLVESEEYKPACFVGGAAYNIPTSDATLYAMYAKVNGEQFVKVTNQADLTEGSYLICCVKADAIFNSNAADPSKTGNYATLAGIGSTIPCSPTISAYAVRITPIENSDYFALQTKNGETGWKYFGSTGSSNGINSKVIEPYPTAISIDGDTAVIANTSGTNRYNFRFNNTRFLFCAPEDGNAVTLYKKVYIVETYTGTPVAPEYQVTYNVQGTAEATRTVNGFTGITLPNTATPASNYKFVGWSETQSPNWTENSPELLTGNYIPTKDVTLYAVYSKVEAGQGTAASLTKMAAGDKLSAGDKIVIVANGTYFVLYQKTQSTSYVAYKTFDSELSVETVADDNKYYLDVSAGEDGKWILGDATNGYFYSNKDNNLACDSSSHSEWTFEDNKDGTFYLKLGVKYLTCRTDLTSGNANLWRLNSGGGSKKLDVYKFAEGTTATIYYSTNPSGAVICSHENTTLTGAVAATCTTDGYTGDYVCNACHEIATYGTKIPAGHDYGAWVSNNDGTHTRTCQRDGCGDTEKKNCTFSSETHVCTACGYEQPSVVLSYSVNGVISTETVYGSTTLPDMVTAVGGYEFVGWSASELAETPDKPETILTGKYAPETDTTLYAIYARAGAANGSYVKITDQNDLTAGQYLIVNGDKAFNGALATPYAAGNYFAVSIVNNSIVSTYSLDKSALTVSVSEDNFKIQLPDNRYIGNTGSGSNINVNKTTEYKSTIVIGTDGIATITAIHEKTDTYCFLYNDAKTSDRFAYYKLSESNVPNVSLYKKTGTSSYFYTTAPGGAPIASGDLKIDDARLNLNDKIDVIYTVTVPDGYTDPEMIFAGPNGTVTVKEYAQSNGKYVFTYNGINPQCMDDNISATLYATKDGKREYVSVENYSVCRYCTNILRRTDIDAKTRTLLSDLLAYGAAAQNYMNYNTDALVTGGKLYNPTYSTFTNLSGLAPSFAGTADAKTYWISTGLTLTNSVAMNFRFYAASTDNLSVTVSINGRRQTFTEFTSIGGDIYEVSFTGISAEEFADTVTASFKRNGNTVGNTVSYSVNTYVQSMQNSTNTNLADLVKALYNYGRAVEAFSD